MNNKKGLVGRIAQSYKEAEGLGDMVASAIKATTGIEAKKESDCGCFKRKEKLNRWVPFHKRK